MSASSASRSWVIFDPDLNRTRFCPNFDSGVAAALTVDVAVSIPTAHYLNHARNGRVFLLFQRRRRNTKACVSEPIDPAPSGQRLENDPANAFGMEDGGELGIAKTVGLFKSLDYGFLLPFRKMFDLSLLKKRAVRWVLFFGLSPIAIYVAALTFDLDFTQTVWLLEAYFCLFWALHFHTLIQPTSATWKRAIGYGLFTAFIGAPLVLLAQHLPVVREVYSTAKGESWFPRLFGMIFGVGIVEESCKSIPLLLFGLRKNKIQGVRDGLFLGFMSGLGFAAAEGVAYSLGASNMASQADANLAEAAFTLQVIQIIFRMMSGPILHAAWSGMVGWFIGLAATRSSPRWPIIVVGIAFAALLHGINDAFAGTVFHLVTAGVSLLVLMAYLVHDRVTPDAPVPADGNPVPKS
jgi:RsiW-degrading membrane proteinase PrsW (M82 family)